MPKLPANLDTAAMRRRVMVDALMQSGLTPPQRPQGRIVANTGLADAVGTIGSAFAARRANRQAEEYETESAKRKRAALVQALGIPQPAQISLEDPNGGPPETRTVPRAMTDEQRQTQAMVDDMSPEELAMARLQMIEQRLKAMTPEPTKYGFQSMGDTLLRTDPRTGAAEPVFENPRMGVGNQAEPPASIQEYLLAQQQGYKGTFEDWRGQGARAQIVEFGGAKYAFNPITKEYVPLSTSGEEAQAGAERTAATTESEARTRERIKVETEVPNDIATIDEQIRKATEVLNRFKRGDFNTGPIVGRTPALTTAGQELESYIGEDVLQRISSATFGALSEGERDFLRRSGMNRANSEAANISILERRITALENMKRAAQQRLQRASGGQPESSGGGWSITRVE